MRMSEEEEKGENICITQFSASIRDRASLGGKDGENDRFQMHAKRITVIAMPSHHRDDGKESFISASRHDIFMKRPKFVYAYVVYLHVCFSVMRKILNSKSSIFGFPNDLYVFSIGNLKSQLG
jgi:hypothetical protein